MNTTIIISLLLLLLVLYIICGVRIISQSEAVIVERLGKYNRTLSAGVNIVLPILEKCKPIRLRRPGDKPRDYTKIDLREQVYDFPSQSVITKDNVMTEINALLYFQIVDVAKAVYEISDLSTAIEKLTQTTLRNVIGELELDETLVSRDTINSKLRSVLDDATNKWGVKVTRVELQDIMPPESIKEAMEKQMQAERDKRAEILKADGEKQAEILRSEGKKMAEINAAEAEQQACILKAKGQAEAQIMQAEAEKRALELISEAVAKQKSDPVNYLLAVKYIEGLKEMTAGQDTKTIYLPYEATSVLGSLGTIKELFK